MREHMEEAAKGLWAHLHNELLVIQTVLSAELRLKQKLVH